MPRQARSAVIAPDRPADHRLRDGNDGRGYLDGGCEQRDPPDKAQQSHDVQPCIGGRLDKPSRERHGRHARCPGEGWADDVIQCVCQWGLQGRGVNSRAEAQRLWSPDRAHCPRFAPHDVAALHAARCFANSALPPVELAVHDSPSSLRWARVTLRVWLGWIGAAVDSSRSVERAGVDASSELS